MSVQYSIVLRFPVIQFSPFISPYCTQLYLLAFNWTLSRCLSTPVASTRLPFNSVLFRSLSYSALLVRHLIYPLFFSFCISNVFSCITLPKYGYVSRSIFTTFFTLIKLPKSFKYFSISFFLNFYILVLRIRTPCFLT